MVELVRERTEKVQTTLRLPRPVYDQAWSIMEQRLTGVTTFNELVIAALMAYIKLAKRKQIDLAFAGMAEDADYQREAQLIAEEFADSDWEAFLLTEKDSAGD